MNHERDGECDATRHIHAAFLDMVHAATVNTHANQAATAHLANPSATDSSTHADSFAQAVDHHCQGARRALLLAKIMHIISDSIFYTPIGHCAALQKAVEHAKASVARAIRCGR